MAWWAYLLLALGLYLLVAGIPWLVQAVIQRLLERQGPFLEAEDERRLHLREALAQQRARWPSVPRLGRFREPDQKALDRLSDLATVLGDLEALWPGLKGYTRAALGWLDVALLRAWPAMLAALRARRGQRQAQALLRTGEDCLEEIILLDGLVADIPSAVSDLAKERAQRVAAVLAAVHAEEAAGTLAIEGLRDQATTLEADVTRLVQQLETQAQTSDEHLLRADQELERIAAATEELGIQITGIAAQRATAAALLAECRALLLSAQGYWSRLAQQGANDPELVQSLQAGQAQVTEMQASVESRTPQAYAAAATTGQAAKSGLLRLGEQLDELAGVIEAAHVGIADDVAAIEDARRAMAALEERPIPVIADASLALIEQAAASYAQAEEQAHVGTLTAYREAVTAAARGKALLDDALRQGVETVQLADRAGLLLDAVAVERRQQLSGNLDELTAELSAYAVMWRNRFATTASEAGQELYQAGQVVAQLPAALTARQQVTQTELSAAVEQLEGAQTLVTAAETRLTAMQTLRETMLRQRQELEAGVGALQRRVDEALTLKERMLPLAGANLDQVAERLSTESRTMLDPAQADYEVALANWLPSLDEELDALLEQHAQDVKRLSRALKDARGRLDRNWRRLQTMLDRDPRRPDEDVDQLYQTFEAWWDRTEAVEEHAAAMADLVEVQAPELDARIQRAVGQLEDGRRTNRDLTKELTRRRRDLDRVRNEATRRGADSGWPNLAWDLREADDLWRRVSEAENASISAPAIERANQSLDQAIALAEQAVAAYQRERTEAQDTLDRIEASYQSVAKMYDAAVRRLAELRIQGPSPELTLLEERLDAARRDLDAARAATGVPEAMQRLQLAQDLLRLVSG